MARAYRMTSARRAAIKKAQAASARKRRGKRRRNIALGAGAVGLGVIGVTLAMKNRKSKSSKNSTGVIAVTVPQEPKPYVSSSKEIDVLRLTIEEKLDKKGNLKGFDFSNAGRPANFSTNNVPQNGSIVKRAEKKQQRAAEGTRGKRKAVAGPTKTKIVKRNRIKFNDDRRNNYSRLTRRERYSREKSKNPRWLTQEHRQTKRSIKLAKQIAKNIYQNGNNDFYDPFGLRRNK